MDQATEQRVRQRAYELWVDAGKPEGSHLRFWKEAEAAILREAPVEGGATAAHAPKSGKPQI